VAGSSSLLKNNVNKRRAIACAGIIVVILETLPKKRLRRKDWAARMFCIFLVTKPRSAFRK
jgi:hypothetical protein